MQSLSESLHVTLAALEPNVATPGVCYTQLIHPAPSLLSPQNLILCKASSAQSGEAAAARLVSCKFTASPTCLWASGNSPTVGPICLCQDL